MNTPQHMAIGAGVAALPDAALALFGWRKRWLEPNHPLVRAHRWLHSPDTVPLIILLAWCSHIVIDRFSKHNTRPWRS